MKKSLILILSMIIGAFVLTSCDNNPVKPAGETNEMTLTIKAIAPDTESITKTLMVDDRPDGGFHTIWQQASDKLGVYTYKDGLASTSLTMNAEFSITSLEGNNATFSGNIRFDSETQDFNLYAYYPRNPANDYTNSTFDNVPVTIKPVQTMPANGTHDPSVDFMYADSQTVTVVGGATHNAEIDDFEFHYVVGFVNLSVKAIADEITEIALTDEVKSVSIAAYGDDNDPKIAGNGYLDLSNGSLGVILDEDNSTNMVTVNCPAGTTLENLSAWMVLKPFAITGILGGIDFTITTDSHTISRYLMLTTLGVDSFEVTAGRVKTFNVTISDDWNIEEYTPEAPATYSLFTFPAGGGSGVDGEFLIVGTNAGNSYIFNSQGSNNIRAQQYNPDGDGKFVEDGSGTLSKASVNITLNQGTDIYNIQWKEAVDGASADYYLYTASSSANHLKSRAADSDGNSRWRLSAGSDGVTNIVATGNNRNTMQFNYNNGTPLFACYGSASQGALRLYKKDN